MPEEVKINLFVSNYKFGDPVREAEIDECLKINRSSGLFSEIIVFNNRPKYNDFFREAAHYPDDINILANSDIYFNETIKHVREMGENECYCITRWEEDGDSIVRFKEKHEYNNGAKEAWSQDVWVIRGKAKSVYGDFYLAIPGCDNRIAHEFLMARYTVKNPCEKIQCIHKHKSHERNYKIEKGYMERIPPPYKFIAPGDEATITMRRRAVR